MIQRDHFLTLGPPVLGIFGVKEKKVRGKGVFFGVAETLF
jgi:hypothetical protein